MQATQQANAVAAFRYLTDVKYLDGYLHNLNKQAALQGGVFLLLILVNGDEQAGAAGFEAGRISTSYLGLASC